MVRLDDNCVSDASLFNWILGGSIFLFGFIWALFSRNGRFKYGNGICYAIMEIFISPIYTLLLILVVVICLVAFPWAALIFETRYYNMEEKRRIPREYYKFICGILLIIHAILMISIVSILFPPYKLSNGGFVQEGICYPRIADVYLKINCPKDIIYYFLTGDFSPSNTSEKILFSILAIYRREVFLFKSL